MLTTALTLALATAPFGDRDACIVLLELKRGDPALVRENAKRCTQRFPACSTFKVPLALMAREHGLIDDKTVFKDPGGTWPFNGWKGDQTPASWLENSVVWVSQQLVPKLDKAQMAHELQGMGFGNADVSGQANQFWLADRHPTSLLVSADELAGFWSRFWRGQLPLKTETLSWVRGILPREVGRDGAVLAGKTGSGLLGKNHRQLGWYGGVLESHGHTYVVVANMEDRRPGQTKGPAGPYVRRQLMGLLEARGLM